MTNIYVIGTHHPYQIGPCTEFAALLEWFCIANCISVIAEEMNAEALRKNGATASVPSQVASYLKIQHKYCDPDEQTRRNLGILESGSVIAQAWLENLSSEQTEARIQSEYRKREQYWIEQLLTVSGRAILFICGSDHVGAFSEKLIEDGYTCAVVTQEWMPKQNSYKLERSRT